ncbi:hypothetical protein DENSPDRAFT_853571 [Dentipellis sp. KUC8613]|nr:hypothetical protein DENSPDRAFT_853571 [Dentipellis sp. KUC8613]
MASEGHTLDSVISVKERGKQEYGRGFYGDAIRLFTQALETGPEDTPLELRRQLLSNRAQSYLRYGDIYGARRDTEVALSPQYTLPDSDASLTAKCLFRHAKLLYMFARYEEARGEFEKFSASWRDQGNSSTTDEHQVLADIERALRAPMGSKARRKADLMRAVDILILAGQ